MSVESLLRGITNKDLKVMVRKALDSDWVFAEEKCSASRFYIEHKQSRVKIGFSPQSNDYNAAKKLADEIRQVTGQQLVTHHKTGKLRHHRPRNRFIDTYEPVKQRGRQDLIERKLKEYEDLGWEFRILTMPGGASHEQINRFLEVARRRHQLRIFFQEMNQPIPEGFSEPLISEELIPIMEAMYQELEESEA